MAFKGASQPSDNAGGQQQMAPEDAADLKRQMEEQASWGFVSRYGRTGRIQSVQAEDKTIQINTPKGALQATVGDGTNIHKTTNEEVRTLTFEELTPGMLVTVDGSNGTRENADASEIQVIPEGEGGFNIQPVAGDGPSRRTSLK